MTESSSGSAGSVSGRSSQDVFADYAPEVKVRTKKMLMWFIIFAVVMLFAGITSALIVLYGKLFWVRIAPPPELWISNALVVLSSLTMWLGVRAVRSGRTVAATRLVVITFLLGLGFVFTQNAGWSALSEKGMGYTITENEQGVRSYRWNALSRLKGEYGKDYSIELRGEPLLFADGEYYLSSDPGHTRPVTSEVATTFNASGALLSVLIYVHAAHLFLGLIYLIVNLVRLFKGIIHSGNWISLHAGGMYWHFMGLLWLYLFFFLFFVY